MLDVINVSRAPNRGFGWRCSHHIKMEILIICFADALFHQSEPSVIMPNLCLVFDFLEKIGVVDENAYLLPFKVPLERSL